MGRNAIVLTGKKFGKLIVIERDNTALSGGGIHARWICKCECGKELSISGISLTTGHTKSCGCLIGRDKPSGFKLSNGEASFNQLYRHYINSAKKRDLELSLSKEQFRYLTKQNCYYCNKLPQQISKTSNNTGDYIYNGIDRLDNTQGYTLDNCVPCCEVCNRAKLTRTESEFRSWVIQVYRHYIKEEEK